MTLPISQSASGVRVLVAINTLGLNGECSTRNCEIFTDTAGPAVPGLGVVRLLYVTRTISAQRGTPALPVAQRDALLAKTADTFAESVIADDRLNRHTCCTRVRPPRDTANRFEGRTALVDVGIPKSICRYAAPTGPAGNETLPRNSMIMNVIRAESPGDTCDLDAGAPRPETFVGPSDGC